MTRTTILAGVLAGVGLAGPSYAAEPNPAMVQYVRDQVAILMSEQAVRSAISRSNLAHADLTEGEILALDAEWRSEVGAADRPTISAVAGNAGSAALVDAVADASGRMTEIIVMDARGLNAAVSSVTSDFWQGDEEKYLETYARGAGSVHVSEVEFDESTGSYQTQISMPLVDASGNLVGAVTVGLDVDAF